MMALRCFWLIFEPVTRLATFCSSITFQSMNCSMSGWSASTITILAARRVVPPDLMAPAARSPILSQLMSPEEVPPPESASPPAGGGEEVGPGPGAVLEQPCLAHPQIHDPAVADQVVADRLDETG